MQFTTYSGSRFFADTPPINICPCVIAKTLGHPPDGPSHSSDTGSTRAFRAGSRPVGNPAYRIGLLIAVTFCIQGRSTTAASMAALIGRLYMMKTLILGVSALSMTALPVAANAATAAPAGANAARALSVSPAVRAGTSTSKSSKLAGLQGASIAPILIGVGILAGVTYLIIDNENDNDRSDSN